MACSPEARCHSQSAKTSGMIAPEGCRSGIAMSSNSSDRASSPFMKAACGAGNRRETEADCVQDMLARDPADGVGQVAESGPMHELGDRRYKRRRLWIAFHDVR